MKYGTSHEIFAPLVALQNKNNGYKEIKWTFKQAKSVYGISTRDLPELVEFVKDNSEPVRAEITALQEYKSQYPLDYARRCFLFALISPQCNFTENVLALSQIMENWDRLDDPETITRSLTVPYKGKGKLRLVNLGHTKARNIRKALGWLRGNPHKTFTYETLASFKGMGSKTIAMALALWDDTLPVFTLDSWMLRLILNIQGHSPQVTVSTTEPGYRLTEGDMIAWCTRCVPDLSYFTIQWTLWNGCFGEHKSHLGIIGKEA